MVETTGIRLSKLMSERGICSRREADEFIAKGWVLVDGEPITELGTRVAPTAAIKLNRAAAKTQGNRVTVLLNKPLGYVSSQPELGYKPAVTLITPDRKIETDPGIFMREHLNELAPAGRLDLDSTGLLVLTQDGRVAKKLIGETSVVSKEYLVRVKGELSPAGLKLLNHGLIMDRKQLKPARVKWQNEGQLNFILVEGRKRQIRRMCEMVGIEVIALKRIRIGKVLLGDLPSGQWRYLRADESF